MTILARLQITPAADRRASPRRQLHLGSTLQSSEEVIIHDLSSSGMLIETSAKLVPFDRLEIGLPETESAEALVVWSSGRYYGCEFSERLSKSVVSAARLRSAPIPPPDLPPPLKEPTTAFAAEGLTVEDPDLSAAIGEEKAPLGVRLRMILASTIILWALIIWAALSLVSFVRARAH